MEKKDVTRKSRGCANAGLRFSGMNASHKDLCWRHPFFDGDGDCEMLIEKLFFCFAEEGT